MAVVAGETLEEHPRNGQSRNKSLLRINEDCINKFSEERENRVTESLPQ